MFVWILETVRAFIREGFRSYAITYFPSPIVIRVILSQKLLVLSL